MLRFVSRIWSKKFSIDRVFQVHCRNGSHLCKKLVFADYGNPLEVVSLQEEEISDEVRSNEVFVKMVAAPIHPADINFIEGRYAVTVDSFPSLIGNEGVAEVVTTGEDVTRLTPGDWVIPFSNKFGTCRSHARTTEDQLIKIERPVPMAEAATMVVGPCTAYRLLHDFVPLEAAGGDGGDQPVVLQNAANSAVGQAVIQMCRHMRVKTVNVVRDRANLQQTVDYLTSLGADVVLTEKQLRSTKLFSSQQLARPRLALNAVGGASATELLRHAASGATLVTYGAMGREPVTVGAGRLIFGEMTVRGFWLTSWTHRHRHNPQRWHMLQHIQSLMADGRLKAPRHTCVLIDNYREALARCTQRDGRVERKQIVVFDPALVSAQSETAEAIVSS